MSGMFLSSGAKAFNADISKWDVSKVTDMSGMFCEAEGFNADISKWDVSKVTDTVGMFRGAKTFNADISKWDVTGGSGLLVGAHRPVRLGLGLRSGLML